MSSKYSTDPQCVCVYDNQTEPMDTKVPDDNILNEEMDTCMSTNPLNPFNPFYVGPPLIPHPLPVTAARDPVDLNSGIKYGEEGTNTFTDRQVLRQGVPYDPSVSLTPLGFKGNKNLTINKMSLYPRYYKRLRTILPNSVFNPKLHEGIAKETVCLALIVDAHQEGLTTLSENLQNLLHLELKNESIPVMQARLDYLIAEANDQTIVKITPPCPYKASWIRNRGDNSGFRTWREMYDETLSSHKGKSKIKKVSQNSSGLGAVSKTTGTNQGLTQTKTTSQNTKGCTDDQQGQAELDFDLPYAVNIKPTEVLRICSEVLKMGLEATTLQRVKLVWEQLKNLSLTNPVHKPALLQSVKSSTIVSRALPSLTPTYYGKRDPSLDDWSNEKRPKIVTDQIQEDECCDHPGIASHQAEIWPKINEPTFKVPEPYIFPSNNIHTSHPKRDIPLQH